MGKRIILFSIGIFLLCFIPGKDAIIQAQNKNLESNQIQLLRDKSPEEKSHVHQHNVRLMRTKSSSILVRYNPISLLFGGMMYFYQAVISPQLPSECLYAESCSEFSKSLILEYGLFKGIFTTSDRLMRCNRISALDVHPLMIDPESGRVNESVEIYRFIP